MKAILHQSTAGARLATSWQGRRARGATKEQAARTKAVQDALARASEPATAAELAKQFVRGRADTVEEILEALVALGMAHRRRGGKFTS